ncbi:MAG TPA: recombinase A [bacterium]|nr:recombinase A [bacterium]
MVVSLARPIHDPRLGEALSREDGWCFEQLAGRLVQLEGAGDSAALTLAFAAILEAQQVREPAAWITARAPAVPPGGPVEAPGLFYPPDAHDNGVDLAALPVVQVPGVTAVFLAADLLLRSGGFGLIVADLGVPPAVPSTALARLAGLARRHHTAMVFLTQPGAAHGSLGSLISVHARARRRRTGLDRFACGVVALKDKHHGPAWQYVEVRRGAAGLR